MSSSDDDSAASRSISGSAGFSSTTGLDGSGTTYDEDWNRPGDDVGSSTGFDSFDERSLIRFPAHDFTFLWRFSFTTALRGGDRDRFFRGPFAT